MISFKKDFRAVNNFNQSVIAPIHLQCMVFFKILNLICLILLANGLMMQRAMAAEQNNWKYEAYLDIGYGHSFNDPDNNLWRSKSTTNKFDSPRINMVFGYLGKQAIKDSPWGMELGIQAGIDADNLIPSPPPETNEPKANADLIHYLYRANATYRFLVGNGLKVSAGLINSYIGYESYLSLDNPNYTRGYITDNVPYFLLGAQAAYPLNDRTNFSFFIVDGWNYLAKSNNKPSYGFQVEWQGSSNLTLKQNLYYGPEQINTGIEYWRLFFDSIISWETEIFLLVLSVDGGTEKQAEIVEHSRFYWMSGAIWGSLSQGSWQFTIRPEFYHDADGIISGAKQNIMAVTSTIGYNFIANSSCNTLVGKVEYRYDRSTGPEGGFYKGSENYLVADQNTLFLSLVWRFDSL